ncbi:MAG: C1 family peptidase [Planctomycetota bacterium]
MIDNVEVDLRDVLLVVRDQEARPTCLAHAVTAAHEHARGNAALLSPEYLYFFASTGASDGVSMNEVAGALEVEGQCQEVHCPYLPQDPPSGWKPPTGLTVFRRASKPENTTPAAVEDVIRCGLAPVLGLTLPEPFFDPSTPWVISSNGPVRGLHAVVAVGLGRHKGDRVFLIRNSWGVDWADGGYAWLDDSFLARHLQEALVLTH